MTIVCGTDFSAGAAEAARAAAALAIRHDETVLLVHVQDELLGEASPEGAIRPLREAIRARLALEAERLRELGASVREVLLDGISDETLVEYAEQQQASLIVISSLGRRSGVRWRLGGTADRVAQSAKLPVLIVRDGRPIQEWMEGRRRLRVLLGADFSPHSLAATQWLSELRRRGPCDVLVGYVYWPPEEHARLGIRTPMDLVEKEPLVERTLMQDLAARIGELPGEGELRYRILMSFGRPADHLVRLAEHEQVDLIVIGTHQRRGLSRLWHGSVSHGVLHLASMAVACVPAALAAEPEAPAPVQQVHSVLMPTDLSELSVRAVPLALAVLRGGGICHLLHVVEEEPTSVLLERGLAARSVTLPRDRSEQAAELEVLLRSLVPADAAAQGIAVQPHVQWNTDVAGAICQTAERLGVDLLCLATHGRSGLSKLLAGSVAQEVIHKSRRPILIVPPPRQD